MFLRDAHGGSDLVFSVQLLCDTPAVKSAIEINFGFTNSLFFVMLPFLELLYTQVDCIESFTSVSVDGS